LVPFKTGHIHLQSLVPGRSWASRSHHFLPCFPSGSRRRTLYTDRSHFISPPDRVLINTVCHDVPRPLALFLDLQRLYVLNPLQAGVRLVELHDTKLLSFLCSKCSIIIHVIVCPHAINWEDSHRDVEEQSACEEACMQCKSRKFAKFKGASMWLTKEECHVVELV